MRFERAALLGPAPREGGTPVSEALDRVLPTFARANPDHLFNRGDEDLAVADAAGAGGVDDRFHGAFHDGIFADDFDLYLRQEVDDVLGAAVKLGMAFLAAETLGFHDGDALQSNLVEGFLDLIEFERLDDGFDFLHAHQARFSRASHLVQAARYASEILAA